MVILGNLKTARDTHDMGSSGVGLKAKNPQTNTDNNTAVKDTFVYAAQENTDHAAYLGKLRIYGKLIIYNI